MYYHSRVVNRLTGFTERERDSINGVGSLSRFYIGLQ